MKFPSQNIAYNPQLDNEFRRLGFDKGESIFARLSEFAPKMCVEVVEPVKDAWILGYDQVTFRFLLHQPTAKHPHYILMVSATTGKSRKDNGHSENSITLFGGLNERGSTKMELIARLYEKVRVNFKHSKAAYMFLMMGKKEKLKKRQKAGRENPKISISKKRRR